MNEGAVGGGHASLAGKTVGFSANAASGKGGQGDFLRQMVLALDALPCRARVFARDATAARAEVVRVPQGGLSSALASLVRTLPYVRRRRDWLTLLDDTQFDASVRERAGELDLLDGVLAQCRTTFERVEGRTRLVLTCLNTHIDNVARVMEEEHERVGWSGPSFVHPRMRERALREIALADRVRVNSRLARASFVERGIPEEKVVAIHPEVDRRHFHPVEKKDGVFRVLAVASIDARKGVHYLLEAFEHARIPGSELVLVGTTGDRWAKRMLRGFLSRNANVRVVSLDVMKAPVDDSYGSASVLVHPALEEGFGLVVPQALASGRPVIATRETGASELLEDGKNGFVVPARSAPALAERLSLLASDRSLRESMGEAARRSIEQRAEGSFAREVASLYESVLARGAGAARA